ncbi:ATP-grasp domain-containing protein [Bacillus cereus group sp. MYBK30-1]|uniref:ATP-grasp domain-containing protein n=1 Tax=unclassified Bacillus cereus group TaxID=2750818 RepID=UPI003F78C1F2
MRSSRFKKFASRILSTCEPYDKFGWIDKNREYRESKRKLQENEYLESAPPLVIQWPSSIPKPYVGLVKSEKGNKAYWPKFERFLKNNNIPYDEIDIKASNFTLECKKFDAIVWRTPSTYVEQWEAADKVDYIQDYLDKLILPSKQALWMYEDKIRLQWLLELYNLPTIQSFISYSKEETAQYIENCQYPFISKDKTCSGSEGVHLIKNKKQARKLWRKIFHHGLKLNNSYIKQKNYVLFQEFVPNKGFDLRVIMVGDSYFGYYRYPKENDYRASGSGVVTKKDIPLEVLKIAKRVRECLPESYLLAVDFLQDTRDDKYYIIETSIFISIESCEQLVVGDVAGRYIEENGEFTFEPGRFWLQELMMQGLMEDWIAKHQEKGRLK